MVVASGVFYLTRGLKQESSISLAGISLSHVHYGTYNGGYKAGRWSNQLGVVVENGNIIEITIDKDIVFALPSVSNELFRRVIEVQNTTVDLVSQATVTSKAYLKSIENALND